MWARRIALKSPADEQLLIRRSQVRILPGAFRFAASGHERHLGSRLRYEGRRRLVWRAKYRLPDARQVQGTIGPAWTARGRPPAGHFTMRTAEAWLRRVLAEAAAGTLSGTVRTGATVADASADYLRYIEQNRQRKPSTRAVRL